MIYLSPIFRPDERGVITKIQAQKKALQDSGIEVILYEMGIFDKDNNVKSDVKTFIHDVNDKNKKSGFLDYIRLINKTIAEIKKINPDYIYVRDRMFFFNLYSRLSKIVPVFVEVQSKVIQEMKNISKKRWILESILQRKYLRKVSGIIAVTNEILNYEMKLNKIDGMVLGNGIDEDKIKFIKYSPAQDSKIHLLFIGSAGMPWHGVDRLVKSFIKANAWEKFSLDIIGYDNIFDEETPGINFHGFINDSELINTIISKTDIAITSLAMFRNHLQEGATLKFRQYLASGLPVITGYTDVDTQDGLDFILEFPNDDSNIDFLKIQDFYSQTSKLRRSGKISEYARDTLTWKKKMRYVWEFITDSNKRWNK